MTLTNVGSIRFSRGLTTEDAVPFVGADSATLVQHASTSHPSVWAKLRAEMGPADGL
jgi:hypothetical protein